jgi:CheY-like chemotaxis protein
MVGAVRVLVVDDNRDAGVSTGMLLECFGADVRVAHDGPDALRLADEWRPAVVLLDLGMPGMDGFEVARRLRARPSGADLLLVALTGWGHAGDRRRTRESGFDLHLVKPASTDALLAVVAQGAGSDQDEGD